jgi:hypothetical protein
MTRDVWLAREFVAKFYAMPLRSITEVKIKRLGKDKPESSGERVKPMKVTKMAILDCGHQSPLWIWLRVGEQIRCPECYQEGLHEAERMIERIGI